MSLREAEAEAEVAEGEAEVAEVAVVAEVADLAENGVLVSVLMLTRSRSRWGEERGDGGAG